MQAIKLRKGTENKIELAVLMIKVYCLLSRIKLSDTDIEVLAYLMAYGFKKSTKQLILSSKILNSVNSLENAISRLRKAKLVTKDRDGFNIVTESLGVDVSKNVMMFIKLENV